MLLYKTNGETETVSEAEVREYWDIPNEGYRKIVIEVDESVRITYKVTNTIAEIDTIMLAYTGDS